MRLNIVAVEKWLGNDQDMGWMLHIIKLATNGLFCKIQSNYNLNYCAI